MSPTLKKALSDLVVNPGRSILVVVALVIGLWGVGSISVSYVILKNDLNENFNRTRPAHVVLTAKNFDRLDLTAFKNRPEIESAEFRDLSLERIEVFPNQWLPLWVFGVESFEHFDVARIYTEAGSRVPKAGTMLIERDGRSISDLKLGSVARVRAAGRVLKIPISGISFDPAQAPASMDHFIYAYVDKITYKNITSKEINQQLMLRLKNVATKRDVQSVSKSIVDYFLSIGIKVDKVGIPKPNEHPHQFQLNTLLFLQGGISLLSFLMGAVLVSQLVNSILAQQIRQIGILKAIGASRRQVLKIYMTMIIILGSVASVIAIPLAIVSGYGFARFVAKQINFQILTTTLPIQMYFYLVAAGLLLPILSSLSALLRGANLSVKDALGDYGVQQDDYSGNTGIVGKLSISNNLRLVLQNTMRRKKRLAITVATMALGVAIFSTGFNVRQAIVVMLSEMDSSLKYDVQLILKDQIPLQRALSPFRSLDNLNRIEAWSGGRGIIQTNSVETTDETAIVALPPDTGLLKLEVLQGRWLQAGKEPEIVVNQKVMETFEDAVVGEHYLLDVEGRSLKVKLVGIVKEFELGKIYIGKDIFDASLNPDHLVKTLLFAAKDRSLESVMSLQGSIEKSIASSDLNVSAVMAQAELMKILYDHLNIVLTMLAMLALLVLVVSALGMASATGINILERTREIGVLRAIGATPKMIYRLFVGEGMAVSVVSLLFGLVLAWPLSIATSAFFGDLILGFGIPLKFALSQTGLLITIATTLIFGLLASRIPARKAIRVSTREALAYE